MNAHTALLHRKAVESNGASRLPALVFGMSHVTALGCAIRQGSDLHRVFLMSRDPSWAEQDNGRCRIRRDFLERFEPSSDMVSAASGICRTERLSDPALRPKGPDARQSLLPEDCCTPDRSGTRDLSENPIRPSTSVVASC